jgi:hypothetical protein
MLAVVVFVMGVIVGAALMKFYLGHKKEATTVPAQIWQSISKVKPVPVRDPERVAELIREGFHYGGWYTTFLEAEKRGRVSAGTADTVALTSKTFSNSKFSEPWENELRWRAAKRVMYPWFKERDIAEQKAKRHARRTSDLTTS